MFNRNRFEVRDTRNITVGTFADLLSALVFARRYSGNHARVWDGLVGRWVQ